MAKLFLTQIKAKLLITSNNGYRKTSLSEIVKKTTYLVFYVNIDDNVFNTERHYRMT